jgi:hypothetical protein
MINSIGKPRDPGNARDAGAPEITAEMIEAGAATVAANLRLYDLDSPSLCDQIAEDALRAGLNALKGCVKLPHLPYQFF